MSAIFFALAFFLVPAQAATSDQIFFGSLGFGYFGSVGSVGTHGGGMYSSLGLRSDQSLDGQVVEPTFHPQKGKQAGFRVLASGRFKRSWLRAYYIWGSDRSLPQYEKTCMSGGGSLGYSLTDGHGFRAWFSGEYNLRGLAIYEVDDRLYNLYKGPAVSGSLDFRLFNFKPLEGRLEGGATYSVGVYANGYTSAYWGFFGFTLEAKPWW